jgi:hypothetical protein
LISFFIVSSSFAKTFATEDSLEEEDNADRANKFVASEWRLFNRNVDTFFSNQKYLVGENKSSIFAYTSFYKNEGGKIETDFNIQMKFDLPRTTKRLKIIVEKEQNEIRKALSDENVTRNVKNTTIGTRYSSVSDSRYTAGANYLLPKLKYFSSLIKFGIRLDMPINPFVKLNMQKDFKLDFVDINLSQNFIEYRQEGFQEISQLAFEKKINETFHAEQMNSLVWSDETDAFDLRNSVSLYQNLGDERGLTYALGANAKLSPSVYYESYDASVSYRQLIYSKWLYGTFTVGQSYPKSDHFIAEDFAQVRLEMFFR